MADVKNVGFTNATYQVCYSIRAEDARTELAQRCAWGDFFQLTKITALDTSLKLGIQIIQHSSTSHLNMEYFIPGIIASITVDPGATTEYGQAVSDFIQKSFSGLHHLGFVSSKDQLTCSISATLGEAYPVVSCTTQPIFEGD